MGQFKHFFMPGRSCLGSEDIVGGTFALINLMFGGGLYANRGGIGYTSARKVSWVIVLQCFLIIPVMDGILGS